MLSKKRDKAAATRFFTQAIGHAGLPDKVVIDKSGTNTVGLKLEEFTSFEQFYALAGSLCLKDRSAWIISASDGVCDKTK